MKHLLSIESLSRADMEKILADAAVMPIDYVLVAQGTYQPDRGTNNRAMSFQMTSGTSIVGGYNSNVIQTSEFEGGPITKRAALYNALEGRVELDFWGKAEEPQSVSVQVLGQQYYKLDDGPSLPEPLPPGENSTPQPASPPARVP